jgi:putative endonuclease
MVQYHRRRVACGSASAAVCHPERSEGSLALSMKSFFVYIMTNRSKTLYIGVTSNLIKRVHEHKSKVVPGFTRKYNMTQLVYYDETRDAMAAIRREKQLKGWLRCKKIALIESINPTWQDLSAGWCND